MIVQLGSIFVRIVDKINSPYKYVVQNQRNNLVTMVDLVTMIDIVFLVTITDILR